MSEHIDLKWVGAPPQGLPSGVTFGVPWPKGSVRAGEPLTVCVAGRPIPTQTWPLAYWPDGSLKWTGAAAVLAVGTGMDTVTFRRVAPPPPPAPLRCETTAASITVDNGPVRYVIGRQGDRLVECIRTGETAVCNGGRLVAMVRRRSATPDGVTEQVQTFGGRLEGATVEQAGPLRVVVKAWGRHAHPQTGQVLFPFTVRLYFYAGDPRLSVTHFFVYDGDPKQDFLQGIGMQCDVPLRDELHNRRVFFGGDGNHVWAENVRAVPPMLPNSGILNPDRKRQMDGAFLIEAGPPPKPKPYSTSSGLAAMPVWNDFRIFQNSAQQFRIWKSCGAEYTELNPGNGKRASGLVALADSRGGICVGQREFWQTYPSELTVTNAGTETAKLTAWFWSPHAPVADLRHYTDKTYGALYENAYPFEWEATPYAPEWVSACGVGKSSRLVIWPLDAAPDRDALAAQALASNEPPLLVCLPEYYHRCGVFGVWSLENRETDQRAAVENRLRALLDHYVTEVDHRGWYGFWDYGDVMHSYDPNRHTWRYDEGGYGWQNNECHPDLWLWYSFLRTGRADVFRLAAAMSRHNADVDVFHLGTFAGLGSRHNVSHWGCNVKTERVSHAGGKRFLYFLTADEHLGDRLSEVLDHHPKGAIVSTVSQGWSSYCWNWLTAWERTGDPVYRDKILNGIAGLVTRNSPFVDGCQISLEMDTGRLAVNGHYTYHMTLPFAGPENWMELTGLLDHHAFADAVAGYGRFLSTGVSGETLIYAASLIGYASLRHQDRELAAKTWAILLEPELLLVDAADPVTGTPIKEILRQQRAMGHTNIAAQWSLRAIQCLELIPGALESQNLSGCV